MNSKNLKKKYTAAILGAGKIASSYDNPRTKAILTHAHALQNDPRTELVALADIDPVRGKFEAKKWNTAFYSDSEKMLAEVKPDIVVIATPNSTHKDLLMTALHHKPRVIILEKPAVDKKEEILSIRRATKKAGVPVIVNFRRRFDATTAVVREALIRGKYGSVLSASAMYSKGIQHNGSHMIDLARYFFGELKSAQMSFTVDDFPKGVPTLGGVATFERCPQFYLMAGDERSFYIFEFTIVTERCRIRFINEGRDITFEDVVQDSVYKEDRVLGQIKTQKTELHNAMIRMISHAVQVADGVLEPHSSIEDALRTQETCYKLSASLKK